jgi:hypothetical protein
MRYFHGSMNRLEVDTVLRGRGEDYVASWGNTDFYQVLEAHRPESCLPHAQAVFAVGDPDDIDLAGGGTEWVFELEPIGAVFKHDVNWTSEVSMLISDGHAPTSPRVCAAAQNYWAGVPHRNESVWEYLIPAAKIILVAPYEGFEVNPVPFRKLRV